MEKNYDFPIKSFKTVEVMQEVERGFDNSFLSKFLDWSCIKDYAYIVHDQDDTRPHIHCMIRFNNAVPTTAILNRCDNIKEDVISFQHLNKCYSWKNAIAYLIHVNAQNKHLYSASDVVSNYDFESDLNSVIESSAKILDELSDKIQSGECRPFNMTEFVTDKFYVKHKRQIDNLFDFHIKKMIFESKGNRSLRLMYFCGDSGSGKTTFAKQFCEKSGMSYYVSDGGANPLDNYGGQDCIILDDLRPSDYKFNEFLKLTDNNTSSMAHCRYYNKSLHFCRCMIITSICGIEDFYRNLQESDAEQAKQLKRRFGEVYCFDSSFIKSYVYDKKKGEHVFHYKIENPCSKYFLDDDDRNKNLERAESTAELFGIKTFTTKEEVFAEFNLAEFEQVEVDEKIF